MSCVVRIHALLSDVRLAADDASRRSPHLFTAILDFGFEDGCRAAGGDWIEPPLGELGSSWSISSPDCSMDWMVNGSNAGWGGGERGWVSFGSACASTWGHGLDFSIAFQPFIRFGPGGLFGSPSASCIGSLR